MGVLCPGVSNIVCKVEQEKVPSHRHLCPGKGMTLELKMRSARHLAQTRTSRSISDWDQWEKRLLLAASVTVRQEIGIHADSPLFNGATRCCECSCGEANVARCRRAYSGPSESINIHRSCWTRYRVTLLHTSCTYANDLHVRRLSVSVSMMVDRVCRVEKSSSSPHRGATEQHSTANYSLCGTGCERTEPSAEGRGIYYVPLR